LVLLARPRAPHRCTSRDTFSDEGLEDFSLIPTTLASRPATVAGQSRAQGQVVAACFSFASQRRRVLGLAMSTTCKRSPLHTAARLRTTRIDPKAAFHGCTAPKCRQPLLARSHGREAKTRARGAQSQPRAARTGLLGPEFWPAGLDFELLGPHPGFPGAGSLRCMLQGQGFATARKSIWNGI
jgi:hypothetical protein